MKDAETIAVTDREIRPHSEEEIASFSELALSDSKEFQSKYDKKQVQVWSREVKGDALKMIKVAAVLEYPVSIVFDVLCDDDYRLEWDTSAKVSKSVYQVADNCSLDYYAMKMPNPITNRELLTVRTWKNETDRVIILNSSAEHEDCPPTKGFVRAISHTTGYVITSTGEDSCKLIYISHVDPAGSIPTFVINFIGTKLAPKSIETLKNACKSYPQWKSKTSTPDFKPWLKPEQSKVPKLKNKDVKVEEQSTGNPSPQVKRVASSQLINPSQGRKTALL